MERTRFEEIKIQHPDLFIQNRVVEDNAFLSRFGIVIPGKNFFPEIYIKHLPQDFLVEEITDTGIQTSIAHENGIGSTQFNLLPEQAPTYYATLVKCGLTTFDALKILAEQTGCDSKQIQYAGIKDKYAITSQRISFRGVTKKQLGTITHPQLFIKDIEAGKGVVTMGELRGNRFTLILRTDTTIHEEKTIENVIRNLCYVRDRGFYNFFYTQRFGTPRLINYEWGKGILLGEHEKVVRSVFLKPSQGELLYFTQVRKSLEEKYGQWSEMLETINNSVPEVFTHEIAMLTYLQEHPTDFLGALHAIEQQSVFWVNAYMSLLYNRLLSDLLIKNKPVPETLPLPLSHEKTDLMLYRNFFQTEGMYPPPWKNLRAFPSIRTGHREIVAKSTAAFVDLDTVPGGIRFVFTLSKGQYATTFLSHIFNIVSGVDFTKDKQFTFTDVATIPESTRVYFKDFLQKRDPLQLES